MESDEITSYYMKKCILFNQITLPHGKTVTLISQAYSTP